MDVVRPAGFGRHQEADRCARQQLDAVGFDQRIEDESRSGLALAIAAMVSSASTVMAGL